MSNYVANCPRCGAKSMTFDVLAQQYRFVRHDWQRWFEIFCICRHCAKSTTFLVGLKDYGQREKFYKANALVQYEDALNAFFDSDGFISIKDQSAISAPEHLPEHIGQAFAEGASCYTISCPNAATTMFRLCVDLVTRPLLPAAGAEGPPAPNEKQRRDLGLRLAWLFENKLLPDGLKDLAKCIREDANDGAHVGNLKMADAQDVMDFTISLLERLVTEPEKIKLAQARRDERRKQESQAKK